VTGILAARFSANGQEVLVDRAQEVGLFRWRIVSETTDVSLSARERGALVRSLAAREHLGAIAEYPPVLPGLVEPAVVPANDPAGRLVRVAEPGPLERELPQVVNPAS
jgi:hypothetical protein